MAALRDLLGAAIADVDPQTLQFTLGLGSGLVVSSLNGGLQAQKPPYGPVNGAIRSISGRWHGDIL
jgi:hypothetical protein